MPRYCLALDLVDDPVSIAAYEEHHKKVWPEILESIRSSGITEMEIYRTGNRMVMVMETTTAFTFSDKAQADASNAIVQKWENLMSQFQKPLPWAEAGQKWLLMDPVFRLSEAGHSS